MLCPILNRVKNYNAFSWTGLQNLHLCVLNRVRVSLSRTNPPTQIPVEHLPLLSVWYVLTGGAVHFRFALYSALRARGQETQHSATNVTTKPRFLVLLHICGTVCKRRPELNMNGNARGTCAAGKRDVLEFGVPLPIRPQLASRPLHANQRPLRSAATARDHCGCGCAAERSVGELIVSVDTVRFH